MRHFRPLGHVCFTLWLAACSGSDLAVSLPGENSDETFRLEFPVGHAVEHPLPFRISGGVPPYTSRIEDCPPWVTLFPNQGLLAGEAPANASGTHFCTYVVTDGGFAPQTEAFGLSLAVGPMRPLDLPFASDQALNIGIYHSELLPEASGGVPPYTYSFTCAGGALPDGMGFAPETRVFAGIPEAQFHDSCTYVVTDSLQPAAVASQAIEILVDPLDRGTWRFRARTVMPGGPCVVPNQGSRTEIAVLPHAQGGEPGQDVYVLTDFPNNHFLEFDTGTRQLTYIHPALPILGTPNTYRYLVGTRNGNGEVNAVNADDVLCLDVQFNPGVDHCPDPDGSSGPLTAAYTLHIQLQVRDDAYWDDRVGEYRCPDTTAPAPRSGGQGVSNPVHAALGPVHARRAVDVAHSAVRDRVRAWPPAVPHGFTISPSVDFASLSGLSGGFDYTGSSRSLSAGIERGDSTWQAGLVAAFTRTDLRYRAEADLSRLGYQAGEHGTDILSIHPFAAWHAPSSAHLWASLGAGLGGLRHRDNLGFPSWSSSDVRLHAYAAGASVPLANVLSGDLDAEAGIESVAFEIKGGDRISTSLPTLHSRDYRAGLAWSAPVRGAPSVSLAYRRLTGDGPEGAQVEAQGSVSAAGILDPRLTLTANAAASFGVGDYEQDSWRLGGGIHFAPDGLGRGVGLELDTRLLSLAERRSAGIALRGEAGYGLWGGSVLGIVRPYVSLIRNPGDGSIRRAVGLNLGHTSTSQVTVEVYDHHLDQSPALKLAVRHRF